MGLKVKKKIKNLFSIETMINKYVFLYHNLVNNKILSESNTKKYEEIFQKLDKQNWL
jgi:hypothetical protein